MNTHDIELPPLPPLYIVPSVEPVDYPEVAQVLMDYARAAVKTDRKRRGEPVAWRWSESNGERWFDWTTVWSHHDRAAKMGCLIEYAAPSAPQPAKPDSAKCAECGAELIPVRPGKWQHPDCSQNYWAADPVEVNAIFETENGEVIGTTDAKVKRVEWQDDGSLTVVIDHWPQSDEPMRCKGCGYLVTDMEHQVCVKAAQITEPESCFCDRMYPDSNPDASCGDCPIRDYGAKSAEPVKSWHDFAPRQHQNPDKFAMPVNVVDKSTHMWKRIEEYSREMDGKKIDIYLGDFLLYCPQLEGEESSGVVVGYYSEPYKGWYTSETLEEVFPTHFMPLPEKP